MPLQQQTGIKNIMEQIRKLFEQREQLSDADWDFFASKLVRRPFNKKALLLKTGQTEHYLSFIEKGAVRFYIDREDRELTFAFAFANGFVSGYDSFLTRLPSGYHIETLTETVLWRLSYDDLQDVYRQTAVGNAIGRYAGEELFLKKSRRELSLLNETAEQRYLKLFTEQPELLQKIPLKYIASYIGITPQALSRIRRRIY
ncbi:Crp/Fnr family transcriptional regulator [Niabella sp. CC-SYL272]|uniref:Crp/Fnr family transcriptional regulator n=1 Tax=Niabella agricola TaxID=2891571 RepID=UPI001F416CFF|nr:Crp/Fnr family transcriptional regulator [Niabella agricola]MCF3110538.1 Crp/Fnr family transcriptional regulator [Niabella agricola]